VTYLQVTFNLALITSSVMFVVLLGVLLRSVRPYKNFERGVATLIWAFPASVLATMILVYLDLPQIFLSLFGGPGLSSLIVPPGGSALWRTLGGVLLALSVFISLVTTGVLEATWR
jgi:hypothetical protein